MFYKWRLHLQMFFVPVFAALVTAALSTPVHADAGPTLQQVMRRNASSSTNRYRNTNALAPHTRVPRFGMTEFSARYDLQVRKGLATPGTAFSDLQFNGTRLHLDNSTAAFPQNLTFLAGALPLGDDGLAGSAGYTTGLAWQSRYRGKDRIGMGVFYTRAPGFGGPGQWLYNLHGMVTPIPGAGGYTLNAEFAALDTNNVNDAYSDPLGARLRFDSPAGHTLHYHLTVARYGSGFHPLHSVVASNWRGVSAGASYHFASGMILEAHTNYGQQGFEHDHSVTRRGAELSISGRLFHFLADSWVQGVHDTLQGGMGQAGVMLDIMSHMAMLLAQPLLGDWDYRFDMMLRDTNSVGREHYGRNQGFRLAAKRPLALGPMDASVGTGLAWHDYSHSGLEGSFEVGMAFNLQMHAHTFGLDVGYLDQQWGSPGNDSRAMKVSLDYTFTFGTSPAVVPEVAPAWYLADNTGF